MVGKQKQGKAPATLTRGEAGEYLISFKTAQGYPSEWATLVSINKKDLSALSEKEISALLYGPVGSTVEIEALLSDGKLKTADLGREAVTKGPLWEHNTIAYSFYDNRSFENWNGAFVSDSLDIEARASQNLILRYANEWPESGRKPLSEALLCAALTNYEVGNLDAGDEYLILSEKEFVPGSRWHLGQNRQLCKAVKLLTSLGRCTDAGKIIDMESAGGTLSEFSADEAFKELVVAQLRENKLEAVATADKFPLVMKKFPSSGSLDRKWVGDVYAKCGEFKKALNSYDQVVRGYPDWDDQWQNVVSLAATVLSRAHVQDKLGRRDAAKTAIEQMIRKFEAKLSRDRIAIIEKMPGVFPKLSNLKSSLAGLDSGAPISFHDDLRSLAPDYLNIRQCHDAIKRGDRVSATRLINLYLVRYRGNVPEPTESDIQNLYCSILTLGREMSNHGWLETSTDVLQKLRCEAEGKDANSMARVFLLFELAYNADKLTGQSNIQWKELEENYYGTGSSKKGSIGSDLVWSERLRRLAIAFYYADELQRAEALINKALASSNKEIRNSRAITYLDGASGEKIMMLLDAACIAAKQKKFDVAEAYWKQILSLPALCRDEFRHTVVELCSVYLASGKREKAIEMLQSIRARPGLQATSAKEVDRNPFQAGKGVTELDLYLAKLLLDAGRAKEAYVIARAVATKGPDRLSWPQCIVVAKCSEAAGDFALAAKCFGLRNWTRSPLLFDNHASDLHYLEKALMLAEKVPRFDKGTLAKLCIEVGESSSFNQPERAYRAYKRAYGLIPASDPRKSKVLQKIENLKSRIATQASQKVPQRSRVHK
ncbi:MAG: hypothetical protein K2Y39_20685 [Candidatus Obscuribacterales bacterium]|nr:hypothetical protein [Candidatus Obscuribacterales bacterium]